jgi:hypothetical protein
MIVCDTPENQVLLICETVSQLIDRELTSFRSCKLIDRSILQSSRGEISAGLSGVSNEVSVDGFSGVSKVAIS